MGGKKCDTIKVKYALIFSCKDPMIRIWTNGVPTNKSNTIHNVTVKEWLYDLLWFKYNRNKEYALTETVLVMESEWKWGKRQKNKDDNNEEELNDSEKIAANYYPEVMYDFQKLLVSNSPIKVLVFKARSIGIGKEIEKFLYFLQERINESAYTRDDDYFLIAYYKKKSRNEYECKATLMRKGKEKHELLRNNKYKDEKFIEFINTYCDD